ncbi:hypothetical protein FA15DRAFT_565754, partial [Coprinopsis marcescibilis]
VCHDFEKIHYQATKKRIKLCHVTLLQRYKGWKSCIKAAQELELLLPGENKLIVDYIIHSAQQGFPVTHKRLKVEIDKILREQLGDEFSKDGVGKQFTDQLVQRNSDQL